MVQLDIKGTPTALTLYEVWEAIVALTATCVRGRQRCGIAGGLGSLQVSEKRRGESVDALKVLAATYFSESPTSVQMLPFRCLWLIPRTSRYRPAIRVRTYKTNESNTKRLGHRDKVYCVCLTEKLSSLQQLLPG